MAEKKKSTSKADKEPKAEKAKKPAVTKSDKGTQKSNKGLFVGIITAVIVAATIGLVALCFGGKTDPSDPKASLSYAKVFFIKDDGKSTLWDAEGKRVTEDEYEAQSDFIAGYAYVKKGDQVGIIKENGEMSVDYGKYGSITAKGGLYLAQDGNTKEYHLLTGAGKDLTSGAELEISSASSTSAFAVVKSKEKVYLYNYDGTRLAEADNKEDAKAELDYSRDFGAFYYDNRNVIFDSRSSKVLTEFEGDRHTFSGTMEDRSKILLKSKGDETKFKLIAGGKVYDLDEMKNYALTALGDVIGYNSYSDTEIALLDSNYKVAKKVSSNLALKDVDNYAAENSDGNVEIYRNGEKIATFDKEADLESGVLYEDYYAITNDGKAQFYTLDGKPVFNHEYTEIWSLFDKHHHAVVSDEKDKYYLIDNSGNRIGGDSTFYRIYTYDGGYEVKNASDGKYAIANVNGETVTEFKYSDTYYRSSAIDRNIWTGENGSSDYDVIDVANRKVLLEHVKVNSFYNHYFTIKNADGKYEYYTYDGTLFYTSK